MNAKYGNYKFRLPNLTSYARLEGRVSVRHLWRMEAAGLTELWKAGDTGDCASRLLWPFVLMIKYCFNVHSPLECFFFTEI